MRSALFAKLLDYDGKMCTSEVMKETKFSRPTALKEMEKLEILDICVLHDDTERVMQIKDDLNWFISDEFKRIRGTLRSMPDLLELVQADATGEEKVN